MEDVTNNIENKEYKLGGVTGKGFMPGVSGNPSGRPKGTMKDYLSRSFQAMSDEEKKQWLKDNKVDGKSQIELGEGKAKQDMELSGSLSISQVLNNLENGSKIIGQTMENESSLQDTQQESTASNL